MQATTRWMPLITAALALVGVALGASVQHLSSRRLGAEARLSDARAQAYVDFIRAYSAFQITQDSVERLRETARIHDASVRIAAFSSRDVVAAVSGFVKSLDDRPGCASEINHEIAMYQAIRAEVLTPDANDKINDRDLAMVLHGCILEVKR